MTKNVDDSRSIINVEFYELTAFIDDDHMVRVDGLTNY